MFAGMVCTQSIWEMRSPGESCRSCGLCRSLILLIVGAVFFGSTARGQQTEEAWQAQVRKDADAHDWVDALRIIDQEIEYQKTAKNAGDDCACDVKLDVPGLQQNKTPVIPRLRRKNNAHY